ncbi:unnamed protein product [Symbiodinium sp. CCMP2592]|nr:unnamed protein product [Symbiodinium sp. CCMP2592]
MPICIWATPPPEWHQVVQQAGDVFDRGPDFLPVDPTIPEHDAASEIPPSPPEASVFERDNGLPFFHETPILTCYFLVLCPMYHQEVITLAVRVPGEDASFLLGEIRSALCELRHDFARDVVATTPQLHPGFGSVVLGGSWLEAEREVIVIYDFRQVGGPVYAKHICLDARYSDVLQEAREQNLQDFEVYLFGSDTPLVSGYGFRAVHGGIIQIVHVGRSPVWYGSFQDKLMDRNAWFAFPLTNALPPSTTYVMDEFKGVILESEDIMRKPESPPDREDIAAALGYDAVRITCESPSWNRLQDIECRGTLCAFCVALQHAPPPTTEENRGIFIFVDARQVGRMPTFTWTLRNPVSLGYLARFAGIHRTPNGFHLSVLGRFTGVDGDEVHVHHGDTVVIGFRADGASDIESSQDDDDLGPPADDSSGSTSVPGHLDSDGSNGDQGSSSNSASNSRSRSPRGSPGPIEGLRYVIHASHINFQFCRKVVKALCSQCSSVFPRWPTKGVSWSVVDPPAPLLAASVSCTTDLFTPGMECKIPPEYRVRMGPNSASEDDPAPGGRPRQEPLANPPEDDQALDPEPEPDSEDDDSSEDLYQASFLVLVPDSIPEQLDIMLSVSDGVPELLQAVMDCRDETLYLQYPEVVPASPQPDSHWGTLLAYPAWADNEHIACCDCRGIDGRLFAMDVPLAATKAQLCHLAGIPDDTDVHVFAYGSGRPLLAGEEAEYLRGGTITFSRSARLPRRGLDLSQMLARPHLWEYAPHLPMGPIGLHYCCIRNGDSRLITVRQDTAAEMSRVTAEVTGLEVHNFSLKAPAQRITDAAVRGFHCQDVRAVYVHEAGGVAENPPLAFVDCRPLLQGWYVLPAEEGFLSHSDLVTQLEIFAPAGWQAQLDNVEVHGDIIPVQPGTVILATYVPVTTDDEGDGPQTSVAASVAAGPTSPSPESGRSRSPAPTGPASADTPDGDLLEFVVASFFIFAQDVQSETVSLRLPIPIEPDQAIARANAAREPRLRERFPLLLEVHPQPWEQAATLVATAGWVQAGVCIFVDLRQINERCFAMSVPRAIDCVSLLRAIGVAEHDSFSVFLRDIPWAIPPTMVVMPRPGDLLQVVPAHALGSIPLSLGDMLRSVHRWDPAWEPFGTVEDNLWVLAGLEHFSFWVEPSRHLQVRPDLARAVGIVERCMIMSVATPAITDHAFRGRPSRNVVAITESYSGRFHGALRPPICILDLRAISLGFSWYAVPGGYLCHQRIVDRFQPRCPDGHEVARLMPDGCVRRLLAPIPVQDGEVVCLIFFVPPPGDLSSSDDSDQDSNGAPDEDDEEDPAERAQPDTASPPSGEPSASSESTPDGHHAGTGKAPGPLPTPCRAGSDVNLLGLPRTSDGGRTDDTDLSPMPEIGNQAEQPVAEPPALLPPLPADGSEADVSIAAWPAGLSVAAYPQEAAEVLGADMDQELAFDQVALGFTPRQMHALFRPSFQSASLADLRDGIPPEQVALRAKLSALLSSNGEELPEGLVCYTDGSFTPHVQVDKQKAGWACVFFHKGRCTCDVVAGILPDWCHNPTGVSAFQAECCALIVGLWLGVAVSHGDAFTILSDCQAAISIACGEGIPHTEGVATILGHVARCCRAATLCPPAVIYSPGHASVLGNEIADVAAKAAAEGQSVGSLQWHSPQGPAWWANQGYLWSWGAVVCSWAQGDEALPSPLADDLRSGRHMKQMEAEEVLAPFLPNQTRGETDRTQGQLWLRFVSYNALSLATEKRGPAEEGLSFQPARPALLANQLSLAGVTCAAIQEARTEEGHLTTGQYLRYCSGAQKGHLGVELWFQRGAVLIHFPGTDRQHVRFDPNRFVVLFKDPRRLGVLFKQGGFQVVFVALHAPHRGMTPEELSTWWRETEELVFRVSGGRLLIIGADCNASLGSVESAHVSSHAAELQDLSGDLLHSCLKKWGVWAPATWASIQRGPTWTFVQRRNGARARPDFVFLPCEWADGHVTTWTSPDVVAANMVIDHVATVAEVRLHLRCSAGAKRADTRRFHAPSLAKPENQAVIRGILESAPRPDWSVSAHAHVTTVTSYLQTELAAAFPQESRTPLHPYLSSEAWDLQKQVAWLRRKCAGVRDMLRHQTLLAVFHAWCGSGEAESHSSAWLRDCQVAEALYGFRLGVFAKALRARCKSDRVAYIAQLADEVQDNKVSSFQAVNRLLCRRRKKPYAPAVLPAIVGKDGKVCDTPEAVQQRWRDHFSALEDGLEVTPETLLAGALEHDVHSWPDPPSIRDIPTPQDLQCALLSAKRGKAPGPDALPGELGILFSSDVERILFPLILKLGLLGEEGLGHKCGALTWLWKGRGSKSECESYRGILLLSSLGKAVHRAYRPRIQQHFTTTASPLQLGGRKGCSVVFGSHAMRTYMRWSASQGQTSAVVFADVSSAYYSTVRSLAAKLPSSSSAALPETENAVLDLQEQLRMPSAMESSGASPWLRALTAELNHGTFMCLQGDDIPIATRRGTRPGSAWADLTFGVVMARILRLRDLCKQEARGAATQPKVPWDGYRHWGPPGSPRQHVCLSDLIWADDLSTCLHTPQAAGVATAVTVETAALADAFESHGLSLTFGPRKTAALLCPKGPGSKSAARSLFQGRSELCVLREHSGAAALPLVATYKHLGVLQAKEGRIGPEIRARVAAAWSAFRDGRTKIFRCRRISLARRGALLQTLVISKLVFGAGAWPPLSVGDRKVFAGALFSLFRLCTDAPDAVWALLRQDPKYLEVLREALDWLFARVRATCDLGHPRDCVETWVGLINSRPNIYKGFVKRAQGLEQCRIACWAALQAFHRALLHRSAGESLQPDLPEAHFVEACLLCRKGFMSRAAWAMHSSKKHGYRLAATALVRDSRNSFCSGCGRQYANDARLRRHLLHASECRRRWGSAIPAEGKLRSAPNVAEPPREVSSSWLEGGVELDPASYNDSLLQSLVALQNPTAEGAWDLVSKCVEPLSVLRETLRIWVQRCGHESGVTSAAEDATLMLDPILCCDTFCRTKSVAPVADCCAELPGPLPDTIPFILTGQSSVFHIGAPPCPAFCHPFIGGAPLSAARKQAAYVEATLDVLGAAVQQTAISRVRIDFSQNALACLEPAPTWLISAGFRSGNGGLHSPQALIGNVYGFTLAHAKVAEKARDELEQLAALLGRCNCSQKQNLAFLQLEGVTHRAPFHLSEDEIAAMVQDLNTGLVSSGTQVQADSVARQGLEDDSAVEDLVRQVEELERKVDDLEEARSAADRGFREAQASLVEKTRASSKELFAAKMKAARAEEDAAKRARALVRQQEYASAMLAEQAPTEQHQVECYELPCSHGWIMILTSTKITMAMMMVMT